MHPIQHSTTVDCGTVRKSIISIFYAHIICENCAAANYDLPKILLKSRIQYAHKICGCQKMSKIINHEYGFLMSSVYSDIFASSACMNKYWYKHVQ